MATGLRNSVFGAIKDTPVGTMPAREFGSVPIPTSATSGTAADLARYMRSQNLTVPEGYHATRAGGGTLEKNEGPWKGLALMGGLLAGGIGIPALMGGGAAAAGSAAASAIPSTALPMAGSGGGVLSSLGGVGGIIKGIGQVAPILSNAAQGRAEGRLMESQANNQRDQLAMQQASGNINADSARLRQAILLSLLSGGQDSTITPPQHIAERMPHISGGLRPSAITGREDIVKAMLPRLLASLESGQHLPDLAPQPEGNPLDAILSSLGLAGSIYGGYKGMYPPPPQPAQR